MKQLILLCSNLYIEDFTHYITTTFQQDADMPGLSVIWQGKTTRHDIGLIVVEGEVIPERFLDMIYTARAISSILLRSLKWRMPQLLVGIIPRRSQHRMVISRGKPSGGCLQLKEDRFHSRASIWHFVLEQIGSENVPALMAPPFWTQSRREAD